MSGKYVIITDLDGTFLDRNTYQPGPALDTFKKCQQLDIPIIFVSAKTRAEIEPIQKELYNPAPFICENGGGLFMPKSRFARPADFQDCPPYWCWCSKTSIGELRQALKNAGRLLDIDIRGFGDMPAAEVADLTGLNLEKSELARCREFDEPYIIINEKNGQLDKLRNELAHQGYGFSSGGNLYHIMGDFDKGKTLRKLMDIYRRADPEISFIGIGDAYNDLPMLRLVDYPFLVRNINGGHENAADIPNLIITKGIGPSGFCEAVSGFID